MKRILFKEIALLLLPIALIAGVGVYLRANESPPKLSFRIEKPTTLEAFAGSNLAIVVTVAGRKASQWRPFGVDYELILHTKRGNLKLDTENNSDFGALVHVYGEKWHLTINEEAIPAGELFLNCKATIASLSDIPPKVLPDKQVGKWKVDRAQITPFPFAEMPRQPLVTLKSVEITRIRAGRLTGESVFSLDGAAMNEKPVLMTSLNWEKLECHITLVVTTKIQHVRG